MRRKTVCYGGTATFALLVFIRICSSSAQQAVVPLVPALFIFGDSLVDVGNNNFIVTLAKANIAPYGIDSPQGPTGRFSNGKTVLDVVCELIGLPFVPPFLDPKTKGALLLKGVNYASGAGGILDASGQNYIQRISMQQQLNCFKSTLSSLRAQLGAASTSDLLSQSLFAIVVGNNDYINNYFLTTSTSRLRYTPQAYQSLLLATFSSQLTDLYRLGARRFVVSSVGPLGCIPSQLAQRSTNGSCVDSENQIVASFNSGLQAMLLELNSMLPGAHFVYADTFAAVLDIVSSPQLYGFTVSNAGCCGGGRFNGQLPCFPRPISSICPDRSKYLFWDPFHPTEAANVILGRSLFTSLKSQFGL